MTATLPPWRGLPAEGGFRGPLTSSLGPASDLRRVAMISDGHVKDGVPGEDVDGCGAAGSVVRPYVPPVVVIAWSTRYSPLSGWSTTISRQMNWSQALSSDRRASSGEGSATVSSSTRRMLAERARNGVDVRLLLPNKLTDAPMVRWAGHHYFRDLLEAGVRIFEYQPTMMHAKMLVVDDVWAVLGSANMDIRSKELNQEGVIGILDQGFSEQIRDTFMADLKDAREITREEWSRRGWLARCNERFWVSFVQQF